MSKFNKNDKDSTSHKTIRYLDRQLSTKTAALYVLNWRNIEKFFSPKTLTEVVKNFKIRDFANYENVPISNECKQSYYARLGYSPVSYTPEISYVTEVLYHGGAEWTRTVAKKCYKYIVPDKYQLNEAKLIKMAIELEFPYMADYEVSYYHFDITAILSEIQTHQKTDRWGTFWGNECYVTIKKGMQSLYVPFVALREKDPDIIISRHTGYQKEYYRNGKDGRQEYLDASLAVLELEETKAFLAKVKRGK